MTRPDEHDQLVPAARAQYRGAAWRARFLRAPKIALEVAARDDFARLGSLATVKLGLKTGADAFFFLERVKTDVIDTQLVPRRALALVEGYDGWKGELSTADIRAAILNPHQMSNGAERFLTVPATTKHVYLYPRAGHLRHGLPEYVRLGELAGLHQQELVRSNAEDGRWYKQARSLVDSLWVLPYNSAYDYTAWYNPGRAVLNGRFVGVEPLLEADRMVLGACLTSTFATSGRLLEGVATGVEGAFDVGPPAARRIMIPDVRRFDHDGRRRVEQVFTKILATDSSLASPSEDGRVPQLRRELDTTLLVALGLTAGKAAVVLDRLYSSYGRWRATVAGVETQMRGFRRVMAATGQSRNVRPTEAAGKRVFEEIEHLVALLPKDFLPNDEVLEVVNVPSSAQLPTTEPLFDAGVIHLQGKRINLGDFQRVRYVGMLRELGIVGAVEVPLSATKAGAIVDLFEKEKPRFVQLAQERAKKYISSEASVAEVVAIAQRHWFTACRKKSMGRVTKRAVSKAAN